MRVWFINLEDPECEIRRKFAAAWKFFGITEDDIGGRLFVTNARNSPICIAETTTEGTRICDPVVHDIIDTINANRIDVVIVDPFVSSHNINENDNRAIDTVAKTWGRIADKTNCAIELVHHTRKLNGAEANEDSARGASALVYAGRDARALNVMTEKQADDCRIDERKLYFRTTPAKANLAPPSSKSDWYFLKSINLPNPDAYLPEGDCMGVATAWKWPDACAGITQAKVRACQIAIGGQTLWKSSKAQTDWVGDIIGPVLGLDPDDKADRSQIESIVGSWLKNGALEESQAFDKNRNKRPTIVPGVPAIEE